ncbi:hypothetical protein AAC691_16980 [Nguyenibacter vanlangensis]|uniref:Intracellular septation protein A n=1 Tax=Nguyenibacter vanlangensis TaxID=1216886 RepID=A0ABZ3D2S7_9PROT
MNRTALLHAFILEIGGLLLFWGLNALGLAKAAAPAVLVFVLLDALRRWRKSLGFPRVWRLFNGLAVLLVLLNVMLSGYPTAHYEGVAVNLLISAIFAWNASGKKPLVQELAEQRQGFPFPEDSADLRAFFAVYSRIWAGYFLLRAVFWFWCAEALPSARAATLEGLIGPLSLAAMIMISFRGRSLFQGARALKLFRT